MLKQNRLIDFHSLNLIKFHILSIMIKVAHSINRCPIIICVIKCHVIFPYECQHYLCEYQLFAIISIHSLKSKAKKP